MLYNICNGGSFPDFIPSDIPSVLCISHGEDICTTEIGKCYTSGLSFLTSPASETWLLKYLLAGACVGKSEGVLQYLAAVITTRSKKTMRESGYPDSGKRKL